MSKDEEFKRVAREVINMRLAVNSYIKLADALTHLSTDAINTHLSTFISSELKQTLQSDDYKAVLLNLIEISKQCLTEMEEKE